VTADEWQRDATKLISDLTCRRGVTRESGWLGIGVSLLGLS